MMTEPHQTEMCEYGDSCIPCLRAEVARLRATEPHQAERPRVSDITPAWMNYADRLEAEVARLRAEGVVYDCPHAEVCKTCPCADEDDACFPGERLRAEVARLRAGLSRLLMYARGNQHVLDLIHELLEAERDEARDWAATAYRAEKAAQDRIDRAVTERTAEIAVFIRDATAAQIPNWHAGQDAVADAIEREFPAPTRTQEAAKHCTSCGHTSDLHSPGGDYLCRGRYVDGGECRCQFFTTARARSTRTQEASDGD